MSLSASLIGAIVAAGAALASAALHRYGGKRAQPWAFVLGVPLLCAGLVGSSAAPWVAPIEGVVSAHLASNSRGCNLVVSGPTHPWKELVSRDLCRQCPVGAAVTKAPWSFAMRCRAEAVDTPWLRVSVSVATLCALALASAIEGVKRLRAAAR